MTDDDSLNLPVLYVIDDDSAMLVMYYRKLSDGFRVITFKNGELALAALDTVRPDIVLCDLCMPWMDGYEVADRIRCFYPDVPIVIATALHGSEQLVTADALGYGFWKKEPGQYQLLKDLLWRSMNSRQS